MYPWISRTLDFWLQFCEKKCGLYMDVYGMYVSICVKASRGSLNFMALACLNMLDFYVCLPCTIAKETTILSHI